MDALTLAQFEQDTDAYDALVMQTPHTDAFCSSSFWLLPAAQTLMSERDPWIWRAPEGYIALMRGQHPDGWDYLEPLEAMWMLNNPLIGPNPIALADRLVALLHQLRDEWDLLLLGGMTTDSPVFHHLIRVLAPSHQLRMGRAMKRHCASLEGGLDGFLSRRKRKFRANLRRAWRDATALNLEVEHCDDPDQDPDALYARIQAIEALSWKGQGEVGINVGRMRDFYAAMLHRLIPAGALRATFLRHQGRDIAYIFGGVVGDTFRGLQFSFDDAYRSNGIGNIAQLHMIERLAHEGLAWYDLGSDIEYKRRWGEAGLKTSTLVVFR